MKFFGYFREIVGMPSITLSGDFNNVGEVLTHIAIRFPEIRNKLFEGNKVMPFVKVLLNGLAIEVLEDLDTKVKDGDTIAIFPPVGGG
ncbi:MAG: ubiquitin-like small modifier protein 1 [Thermoplasmata archaeon]